MSGRFCSGYPESRGGEDGTMTAPDICLIAVGMEGALL
jgi:hypothetical protein